MSALSNFISGNANTTSMEGRHCIFSKHPVSEIPPGIALSTNRFSSGNTRKEVNETVD
jgi:hypothetical protein